jgi:hypothetical protein
VALPIRQNKIDRSFMQGFDGSGRDAETVVKTIIALGRELHMRVTVEGVETAKQAAFLDKADGDQAQGFFFGRPLPASEVAASIFSDSQKTLAAPSIGTDQETRCASSPALLTARPGRQMEVRCRHATAFSRYRFDVYGLIAQHLEHLASRSGSASGREGNRIRSRAVCQVTEPERPHRDR